MNKIDWKQYVDYIFCLHYLPNNRLNEITKTLTNIGINVNDSKFFSFAYDYEHCIFKNQYEEMNNMSSDFIRLNSSWGDIVFDDNNNLGHGFYIGLITYRILKIAQYFNYDRIIIFEDDIKFIKDTDYIVKAMNFIKEQNFDMCMCQTWFIDAYHGIKSYLINAGCKDFGNDMFLKVDKPMGIYGGGFIILTNKGINKIINYFESNNLTAALDDFDGLRDKMNLSTLFALKPLCVQGMMFNWSDEEIYEYNANMNINEY